MRGNHALLLQRTRAGASLLILDLAVYLVLVFARIESARGLVPGGFSIIATCAPKALGAIMDDSPLPQRARAKRAHSREGMTTSSDADASGGSASSCVPPAPVDIDGSLLEGGGQIIRVTSALSAILGTPIRLDKIRAGRAKGGLGAQHAAGLRLVGQLSGASLEGDKVGSSTAEMRPSHLAAGGRFVADAETAGATMLMLQSALPCCCFGEPGAEGGASTQLVLKGGTNVPFAPQLEYMQEVTLAALRRIFRLDVSMSLLRRGCFPRGGGEVSVEIKSVAGPLPAFQLLDRGHVAHVYGRAWTCGQVSHDSLRRDMADCCRRALSKVVCIV